VRTGKMGVKQAFALMPLTNMDAVNGSDYGVEVVHWVFPKGTMIQDLESQMETTGERQMERRSGLSRAREIPQA